MSIAGAEFQATGERMAKEFLERIEALASPFQPGPASAQMLAIGSAQLGLDTFLLALLRRYPGCAAEIVQGMGRGFGNYLGQQPVEARLAVASIFNHGANEAAQASEQDFKPHGRA